MKTFKCASLDGRVLDYVCMSEKDGPDIKTYASARLIIKHYKLENGETLDYDVSDDDALEHLNKSVILGELIEVPNGLIDLVTEEIE